MTDLPGEPIPPELVETPSTEQFPDPPVETNAQKLPVDQLQWQYFEGLCLRIARLDGDPSLSQRYGTEGQNQGGIDLLTALEDDKYVTYQCKKYANITPSVIKNSVTRFIKGPWRQKSQRFVFCTSASLASTKLTKEVAAQRRRLAKLKPPVEFRTLDAAEISLRLKLHRPIIEDFFGPVWANRFLGVDPAQAVNEEMARERLDQLNQLPGQRTMVVSHDWAPESFQPKLKKYSRDDPDGFARLSDLIGTPPDVARVREAVTDPPRWLQEEDDYTWDLLALACQVLGEWSTAVSAWKQKSERLAGPKKASALVQAAVAATMDEDESESAKLLDAAEKLDPGNIRLALQRLDDQAPADEQLKILEKLKAPDDPDERALVAAHKALALILSLEIEAADEVLEIVREQYPHSAFTKGLEVTLTVQKGRLSFLAGDSLNRADLESAAQIATETRKAVLKEKRWSEATRLLMLSADIAALLGDRAKASKILRKALPEEKTTTDQIIVLGSCAIGRALDFGLALSLIEDAEDCPEIQLIRFEALEAIGNATQRKEALAGLDQLVQEGGRTAPEAALARLAATLGTRPTPWSEDSATYLQEHDHERAAITARAFYLLKTEGYDSAVEILEPHLDKTWALAIRVRLTLSQRAPRKAAIEAAEALIAVGPLHSLRVEAGRAFGRAHDFPRAREVLVSVAREPGAPTMVRAEAYDILMSVVGTEQQDWTFADKLYKEWTDLRPEDPRSPKWAPHVANRLRYV